MSDKVDKAGTKYIKDIYNPPRKATVDRRKQPRSGDRRKQVPVQKALGIIESYGSIDGAHHKMWVLDQVVRVLTGSEYDNWVAKVKAGEDGPDTYDWDVGIAP